MIMRRARVKDLLGVLGLGLALSAGASSMAPRAEASRPKLLVQDLTAQGVEGHEAAVISTAACNAIAKSARHEVLCGDDLRNLLRFGALAASFDGCADETCYATMGKAMQARFVVSGAVSKLGGTYVLSLSMFDTEAGRPVARTEVKADSIERLHAQADEAASALLGKR